MYKRCSKRNRKTKKCKQSKNARGKNSLSPSSSASPDISTLTLHVPSERQTAARTLKSFMLRKKTKITANFLKHICSDSGVCIAFGTESDKIKRFFNHFTNFDYAVGRRRISAPLSNNGFVYEIEYARQDYIAHAILKSAIRPNADNLMYEYTVGKTINTLFNNYFPCFVETYGVYKYTNEEEWVTSQDGTNDNNLQDILTQYLTTDFKDSCLNSKHLCLLIQHIKDAPTLHDKIMDMSNPRSYLNFFEKELLYCLYQIYYSLSMLSEDYTHYDLIGSNILLYKPADGKYIQYHYYLQDDTGTVNMVISFKSRYIVKIIDYGRSYVNDSMSYYKKICSIKECNPNPDIEPNKYCGEDFGYAWLDNNNNNFFINSSLLNKSHDLKLLYSLRYHFERNKFRNDSVIKLREIIDNTIYTGKMMYSNEDKDWVRKYYGTPSNPIRGYPELINNVMDAERALRDMVLDPDEISKNDKFHNDKFTKLGDLHVYGLSRKMKYVPMDTK